MRLFSTIFLLQLALSGPDRLPGQISLFTDVFSGRAKTAVESMSFVLLNEQLTEQQQQQGLHVPWCAKSMRIGTS